MQVLTVDSRLVLDEILFLHVSTVTADGGVDGSIASVAGGWIFDRTHDGSEKQLLTELPDGVRRKTRWVGGERTVRCVDDPVAVARAVERVDESMLLFGAKKALFHNYMRKHAAPPVGGTGEEVTAAEARRGVVDSASEAATTGRLSQCRRLPESVASPGTTTDDMPSLHRASHAL